MDGPGEPQAESGAGEPRSFAKRVVDPLNSITWFLMDALWMCKLAWPAYAFAAVTVVTGVWLLILGRRQKRDLLLADLGLNCWIVMNTVWLVADLNGYETRWRRPSRSPSRGPRSCSPPRGTRRTPGGCGSTAANGFRQNLPSTPASARAVHPTR